MYGLNRITLIGLGTSYKPMKLRVVSKVHGIVSSSLSLCHALRDDVYDPTFRRLVYLGLFQRYL